MAILSQDKFDQQVLDLINAERVKQKLDTLVLVEELDTASDKYAKRLALGDFFEHTDPVTQSKPWDRAAAEGYTQWSTVGENIAAGYSTPESVVDGWLKSPDHRENILNPNFTHTGIGYYYLANDTGESNWNRYWVNVFGAGDPTPGTYVPEVESNQPLNLRGTRNDDLLTGDVQADVLRGIQGQDTLKGLQGNDTLFGGSGNDYLHGDSGNDQLIAGTGRDRLLGGKGRDRLRGTDVTSKAGNEIDYLLGGSDGDLFFVGDRSGHFYNDGQINTLGANNYALIRDFSSEEGDRIIAHGEASDYRLGSSPQGVPSGTALFLRASGQDELIAVIRGETENLSLNDPSFVFQQ